MNFFSAEKKFHRRKNIPRVEGEEGEGKLRVEGDVGGGGAREGGDSGLKKERGDRETGILFGGKVHKRPKSKTEAKKIRFFSLFSRVLSFFFYFESL